MRNIFIFGVCLISATLYSQTPAVTIDSVSNYNSWGWKAIVIQNDLITFATVPVIGGRVMKYDLGSHPSIFVNPSSSVLGKTFTPAQNGQWYNFGGYKTWPSPQGNWPGSWPPPPKLDYGNYTYQIVLQTSDSVSLLVTSPIEQWIAPGIQFERKATAYAGTSRIRMEQTIINQGTLSVSWGVWDITQSIANHAGQTDYENFWVYFPINPDSQYGESGVNPQKSSQAWQGEVAPGIYGVQFVPDNTKIFADPHIGWIAYADNSDSIIYAKTFDIFEGANYPDDGARLAVYVGANPAYMEVEVTAPVVELAGGGGRYTFTENWWAAKLAGPVLDVNTAGAIANRLSYTTASHTFSATYGVFHKGTAKLIFTDSHGAILAEGLSHDVSPLAVFQLDEIGAIPDSTKTVKVLVYNAKDELAGTLDSSDVSQLITSIRTHTTAPGSVFQLDPNYPNPFNPSTMIGYSLPQKASVAVTIYDMQGREIKSYFFSTQPAGYQKFIWDGRDNSGRTVSSGIYSYRVRASSLEDAKIFDKSAKMILMK